jgi:hypothetical protein
MTKVDKKISTLSLNCNELDSTNYPPVRQPIPTSRGSAAKENCRRKTFVKE